MSADNQNEGMFDRVLDTADRALDRGPLFILAAAPVAITMGVGAAYVLGVTARETGKAAVGIASAMNPLKLLRR